MPLKYALCPDGEQVEVEACLKRCRRPEGRCLTLPTLHAVLREREKVVWGCPNCGREITSQDEEFLRVEERPMICPDCRKEMDLVYLPSTTELLNGTRLSFLKLTKPYTVDPMERAFALLGTRHHQRLEAVARKLNVLSEEKLKGEISGILDLLEPDEGAPYYCPECDYSHKDT